MKKSIFTGALITLLCIPSYAYAKGSANVRFEGNRNITVGDEFKVNMVIDNISEAEGGVVAFSGYVSYDKDLLEIVDAKSANEYFDVVRNKNIDKIVGLDYSLTNGINNKGTVYEITFRGLNEGNTTITLRDAELCDKKAEFLDVNTNGLNVTINKIEEEIVNNPDLKAEEKVVNTVKKEEKVETPEEVIEEDIENKEEIVVKETVKKTKKTVKNTAKGNKFTNFFKNLFNKIFKKTTDK